MSVARAASSLALAAALVGCSETDSRSPSATGADVGADTVTGATDSASTDSAEPTDTSLPPDTSLDTSVDTGGPTPETPPPLPTFDPLPVPLASCDAPPEAMAFPDSAMKVATSLYHFNIQYVAGGLENYLETYTASEEALEDAIIVESFEPLVALYERHPTWGGSFEMQGLMLEIMAERHPTILNRLRTLAARGQVDVMSYHYSDQLVTAYSRRDMEWSWAENQRIFDGLCVPRAPVHFLQEGQYGPGIAAFAREHDEVVVLPRNLFKLYRPSPPEGLWFDNLGTTTITTDGHSEDGFQYVWTFVDDGELLATGRLNPYLPDVFKKNDQAIAEYEAELTGLEAQGFTIAPVSFVLRRLEAIDPPKVPLDPPVLDGSWQPKGSNNMHLWMGGMGQEPGSERDNLVNTQNVALGRAIAAADALRARAAERAKPAPGPAPDLEAVDAVLRAAKRELLLAEVSDATGWRPVHTEVKYALRHAAEAKRLTDAAARHLLWYLGHRTGQVQVDVVTGDVSPVGEPQTGTPLASAPAGLESVKVTSERPATLEWTDYGAFVELTVTHPATETIAVGSEPPPRIAVELPFANADIAYSSAVAETAVLRTPNAGYSILASTTNRLGLPLVNGLLELAPGRTLVLDLATIHLAALIGTSTVTFEDRTQPGEQTAVWKLRFYAASAEDTLAAANALNAYRPAVFALDVP